MHTRNFIIVFSALAALAACGGNEGQVATGTGSTGPALPDMKRTSEVTPAIIPPDEAADPIEPPSYEVAIASAAASRNTALARCRNQPSVVRTECEQAANAAFAEAETKLQDLRGIQD